MPASAQAVTQQQSGGEIGPVVTVSPANTRSAGAALQLRIRAALAMPDMREDVAARLETFRARQQALRDEREAHYAETITRIRSVTAGWAPPSDDIAAAAEVDTGWDKIWRGIVDMTDCTPPSRPRGA